MDRIVSWIIVGMIVVGVSCTSAFLGDYQHMKKYHGRASIFKKSSGYVPKPPNMIERSGFSEFHGSGQFCSEGKHFTLNRCYRATAVDILDVLLKELGYTFEITERKESIITQHDGGQRKHTRKPELILKKHIQHPWEKDK
jgi:hypothetical protein